MTMTQAFIGNGRKVHDVTGHNTVACGRNVSWLSSTSEATDCQGCVKARKSGVEILADMLSLDGTPAKVTHVPNPKRATVRPKSCGNPKVHSFCATFQCTGRLGECEACHGADAAHSLVLSGTIAGSSSPVTKGVKLYLCTPCYRAALASVDERGTGGFAILWHTQRFNGMAIQYNNPQHTTRYVFLNTGSYDAAWSSAREKAREVQPGYAPTITDVMFYSPNAQRAYLVTRNGVDAVEYMTPGEAWGLAWDIRHLQRDGTFSCAEVDPITGDVVEWIWVGPRVGDVLSPVTTVTWSHATVVSVSADGRTCMLRYVSPLPELNELISTDDIPMSTFDMDVEVKANRMTIKKGN